MTVTKELQGKTLIMAPEGRLDTLSSPELEAEFEKGLDGVGELIMDFSKVEYITSAGLRVLLSARRKLLGRGTVRVINANEAVRGVFTLTGCSRIFGMNEERQAE